jgi:drug/metabolite transporter (DMT)-like permease
VAQPHGLVTPRQLAELLLLAALWGASFLFMRIAAPAFGPWAMAEIRVGGAGLLLLPILAWRGELGALGRRWRTIGFVGVANSAVPFVLYGVAALSITAGLASIFNAATPLFAALIGWAWLREPMTRWRALGLAVGFIGVVGLAWDKAGVRSGAADIGVAIAIGACLLATLAYGFSANFTRKRLAGVPSMALAAGSQISAAIALAVPATLHWPAVAPDAKSWAAVVALSLLCSGLAYILYFRLIAAIGATNASAVTFLIPVFGMLWGSWLLDEPLTASMALGCAVILAGTALVLGLVPRAAPAGARP